MRLRFALTIGIVSLAVAASAAPPRPNAKAQALARAARDDRAQALGLQAQIADLNRRLALLGVVEGGAADKPSRLTALRREETALSAQLGRSRSAAAKLLGVLVLFRRDPPPALLVHPQSARDAVRAQILARALMPELERRNQLLLAKTQDLERLHLQVQAAREDLFSSRNAQAGGRGELQRMIADKQAQARALLADASAQDAALAALARASGSSASVLGRLDGGDEGPAGLPARFLTPVDGRLVARFGKAARQGAQGEGFTWRTTPGAPVLAPAGGVVDYAGPLKDYGIVLILRAAGPYRLVLAGLGSSPTAAGRTVLAGEPVGRMPEDGDAAPDLYLEVRKDGEPVDPQRWFRSPAPGLRAATSDSLQAPR